MDIHQLLALEHKTLRQKCIEAIKDLIASTTVYAVKLNNPVAYEFNLGKTDNRDVYAVNPDGTIYIYSTMIDPDDSEFEDFDFTITYDQWVDMEKGEETPEMEDNIDVLESLETEVLLELVEQIEKKEYTIIQPITNG